MMNIYWDLKNSQLGQAPPPISLEDHVLQRAQRDPGAGYRTAQRQADDGEVQFPRKEFHTLRST